MQSVVTESAEALGRSGKSFLNALVVRCFPPYRTRYEGGPRKIIQSANSGLTSPEVSIQLQLSIEAHSVHTTNQPVATVIFDCHRG